MYLKSIENPVTAVAVNLPLLQKAFDDINRNFNEIQLRVHSQGIRVAELQTINTHLMQLLNWIATTNPQILDEFQTTATAFDKLIPRDDGGGPYASPQA
jgi:hypothetical protein